MLSLSRCLLPLRLAHAGRGGGIRAGGRAQRLRAIGHVVRRHCRGADLRRTIGRAGLSRGPAAAAAAAHAVKRGSEVAVAAGRSRALLCCLPRPGIQRLRKGGGRRGGAVRRAAVPAGRGPRRLLLSVRRQLVLQPLQQAQQLGALVVPLLLGRPPPRVAAGVARRVDVLLVAGRRRGCAGSGGLGRGCRAFCRAAAACAVCRQLALLIKEQVLSLHAAPAGGGRGSVRRGQVHLPRAGRGRGAHARARAAACRQLRLQGLDARLQAAEEQNGQGKGRGGALSALQAPIPRSKLCKATDRSGMPSTSSLPAALMTACTPTSAARCCRRSASCSAAASSFFSTYAPSRRAFCAETSDSASRAARRAASISRHASWLSASSAASASFSIVSRSSRAQASASEALSCCTRSSRERRSACAARGCRGAGRR